MFEDETFNFDYHTQEILIDPNCVTITSVVGRDPTVSNLLTKE